MAELIMAIGNLLVGVGTIIVCAAALYVFICIARALKGGR